MTVLDNKALHQTRRGGVAHFVRRGPVVEARLAGEGRCYAHYRGAEKTALVNMVTPAW